MLGITSLRYRAYKSDVRCTRGFCSPKKDAKSLMDFLRSEPITGNWAFSSPVQGVGRALAQRAWKIAFKTTPLEFSKQPFWKMIKSNFEEAPNIALSVNAKNLLNDYKVEVKDFLRAEQQLPILDSLMLDCKKWNDTQVEAFIELCSYLKLKNYIDETKHLEVKLRKMYCRYIRVMHSSSESHNKATDDYNKSLLSFLRQLFHQYSMNDARERARLAKDAELMNMIVEIQGFLWKPEDFEKIEFCPDYITKGLPSTPMERYGIGVPLIVYRNPKSASTDFQEKLYPQIPLTFPATAMLYFTHKEDIQTKTHSLTATLAIYNPYEYEFIRLPPDQTLRFASSVKTPLAAFLSNSPADVMEVVGLYRPSTFDRRSGVFMMEPFDPTKIPVIFVNGLGSSPKHWMTMCSALRADKVLNKKYQFWFFLYGSGNPFVFTSAILRASLTEIKENFASQDTTRGVLQNMILIGHSMGGVIAKLAVQDVGSKIYDALVKVPFETLVLKDDHRAVFSSFILPKPLNFVKRIIFIATPHKGSHQTTHRLISMVSSATKPSPLLQRVRDEVTAQNPVEAFTPIFRREEASGKLPTNFDALAIDNPILQTLAQVPVPSHIPHHSIIAEHDEVISQDSAKIDTAVSTTVVRTKHSCLRDEQVINEVKRILEEVR